MPNQYNLTLINKSDVQSPTFAVFAMLPNLASPESISLAWLARQINKGNVYRFTWDIEWGFTWSAQGAAEGYEWNGSGTLPADPLSDSMCRAKFDYNGDFMLLPNANGSADGTHLWVEDTPRIPKPSQQESSVGLTLDGRAICAVNAGPNLEQVFTLHPTYYIDAGTYVPGQMVDVDSVTAFQELQYLDGNTALTATLNPGNTWTVQPSNSINFARQMATAGV
jgi:hypothetical protein